MDGSIRQQGNMPGTLDGQRQMPLVLGAVAGNTARNDLAAFRHKKPQRPHVFIVDTQTAVSTEATDLATVKCTSFSSNNHGVSPYDQRV
jgi:hypothetical protein